jgi:hypothetical protein
MVASRLRFTSKLFLHSLRLVHQLSGTVSGEAHTRVAQRSGTNTSGHRITHTHTRQEEVFRVGHDVSPDVHSLLSNTKSPISEGHRSGLAGDQAFNVWTAVNLSSVRLISGILTSHSDSVIIRCV